MNKFFNYLINSIYIFSLKKNYKEFFSFEDINKIQNKILLKMINDNESSVYGAFFDFKNIKNYEEFQKKVPITTYEDYEPYIKRISNGELNVLTTEKVILLEPTSGSSSKKKLIPYTKSLKEQFQRGISPWLFNLYNNYGAIKYGKSYWSISPSNKKEYTKGGIPIGFEEDGAYLGYIANKLMKFIFAVPQEIKNEKNINDFYLKTAKYLLACKDLSIISVWHPSFLLLILDYIEENMNDLELSSEDKEKLRNKEYQSLWPELKVISCWTAGNSKEYYNRLKKNSQIQFFKEKGLYLLKLSVPFL